MNDKTLKLSLIFGNLIKLHRIVLNNSFSLIMKSSINITNRLNQPKHLLCKCLDIISMQLFTLIKNHDIESLSQYLKSLVNVVFHISSLSFDIL